MAALREDGVETDAILWPITRSTRYRVGGRTDVEEWPAIREQVNDVDVERPIGQRPSHAHRRYRITLTEALRDRSGYRELDAGPAVRVLTPVLCTNSLRPRPAHAP